jgi:hypothetical protein
MRSCFTFIDAAFKIKECGGGKNGVHNLSAFIASVTTWGTFRLHIYIITMGTVIFHIAKTLQYCSH